jgi:hypothetical protein
MTRQALDPKLVAHVASVEAAVADLLRYVERQGGQDDSPPTHQLDIRSDDLIDTKVAARRFGIPEDTIRSWCRQKGIGVKPAGRWLVSVSLLRAELRHRRAHRV